MYIESFPECCGINIITGFPDYAEADKIATSGKIPAFITKYIDDVIKGDEFLTHDDFDMGEEEPDKVYPGLYVCALNAQQRKAFETFLRGKGFVRLKSPFTNPKTGNDVTLWGLVFKPNHKMKAFVDYEGNNNQSYDDESW